jgi:hypothetical protein
MKISHAPNDKYLLSLALNNDDISYCHYQEGDRGYDFMLNPSLRPSKSYMGMDANCQINFFRKKIELLKDGNMRENYLEFEKQCNKTDNQSDCEEFASESMSELIKEDIEKNIKTSYFKNDDKYHIDDGEVRFIFKNIPREKAIWLVSAMYQKNLIKGYPVVASNSMPGYSHTTYYAYARANMNPSEKHHFTITYEKDPEGISTIYGSISFKELILNTRDFYDVFNNIIIKSIY